MNNFTNRFRWHSSRDETGGRQRGVTLAGTITQVVAAIGLLLTIATAGSAQIRVACVGDSITAGLYPGDLQNDLGSGYLVGNFGHSGATMGNNEPIAYPTTQEYIDSSNWSPNIVIIMLGTNDASYWSTQVSYDPDYQAMVAHYRNLASHPVVYVMTCTSAYNTGFGGPMESHVDFDVVPAIVNVKQEVSAPLIDNHAATANHPEWSSDNVHPNATGYQALADFIAMTIRGTINGNGIGLHADYFNTTDFTGSTILSRTDRNVNFPWDAAQPDPWLTGIANPSSFSVRWTGQVLAPVTGSYTFQTVTAGGIRLWVNNQQILNDSVTHSLTTDNGTINLTAGLRYPIQVEYFITSGSPEVKLNWFFTGQGGGNVIPLNQLYAVSNTARSINAGGPAAGAFVADTNFSGGFTATSWTGAIDTTTVTSPAPQAVYQSERYGDMTYAVTGLTPGSANVVRLHMCENFFTASGSRTFNVVINGSQVLTNYDIFAATGAPHKATVQQFNATADAAGNIIIAFKSVINNALINGIEVTAGTPVPQAQIASGTPVIDGAVDAVWSTATSYPLTKTAGIISGASDCSASWQGLWDATNLYILASVTDDVKNNDSTNPWDDDSVELYLDADHNGGTVYDANDRQIFFGWGDAAAVEGAGRAISGVIFAKADPTGTTYRIEAKIPWAVEAFTPAANAIIGVDVHVNDDDDGAARDGKIIWNDGTDQAYANPSLFGTGKLIGGGAPPVPTGLNATAGNAQVVLTWGVMSGATSYNVKRSTVSGSGYVTIASPTATNYTNTGLTNGMTYYYVASSVNANGESANCAQVSATPAAIPAAPAGLAAVPGIAQVWLTWTASTGATTYNVKRSTVSGSGYATVGSPATAYFSNTGLTNGTTYYYVVTAVNGAGESGNSNQASAAPSATVPQAQIASGTATIDGNVDAAWANATPYLLSKNSGTISSYADCSATWQGMWDATNLYVLVNVTDDAKINDSTNPWDDDSIEVYLDADHNGGTTYDANDRQIICGWGDAAAVEGGGRAISGVTFAKADPTSTSYRIEAKIPWTVEAFTPAANAIIGVDVHVNDDDDGAARDGKVHWNDATDQAYLNPSLFGAGKLLAAASGGSLTGTVANIPATVNLTTEGTIDWAHWGLGGVLPGYDHKSSGGTKISNYTATGTVSAFNVTTGQTFGYTWTDGTPTASATNSESGVSVPVVGNNFVITAPADTTTKTLKVYCGGWQSRGQITAHLSDGSAVDYVDSSQTAGVNASFNVVYTLTYKAASAGQTLTVTWKENTDNSGNGGGNSSLQAATLH